MYFLVCLFISLKTQSSWKCEGPKGLFFYLSSTTVTMVTQNYGNVKHTFDIWIIHNRYATHLLVLSLRCSYWRSVLLHIVGGSIERETWEYRAVRSPLQKSQVWEQWLASETSSTLWTASALVKTTQFSIWLLIASPRFAYILTFLQN